MADAQQTVEVLFQGTDNVTPAVQAIDASVSKVGESADKAAQSLTASTGKMQESFQGASDGAKETGKNVTEMAENVKDLDGEPLLSIDKLEGAIAGLATVAGTVLVAAFLKVEDAVDSFNDKLKFSLGDQLDLANEFGFVQEAANRFGISVLDAAENYAEFLASTAGSSATTNELRSIFEAVSGSIEALGENSGEASKKLDDFAAAISDNNVSFEDLEKIVSDLPGGLNGFAQAIDKPVESLRELTKEGKIGKQELLAYANALNDNLGPEFFDGISNAVNRFQGALVGLLKSFEDEGEIQFYADAISLAAEAINKLNEASGKLDIDFLDFAAGVGPLDKLRSGLVTTGKAVFDFFNKTGEGLKEIEVTAQRVPDLLLDIVPQGNYIDPIILPLEKVNTELQKTQTEAGKVAVELEKLASNERIALIEAKVELDIATLEGDAKKAVALIEAVGDSVTSARDLLGSLFGELGEAENFRDRFAIEDQIELENERLERSLELQEKQVAAQLRLAKLREEALRNGDTTITVNGDGLQPHLEAFMWEVLEAVQVRVNAQGLDMLLGAP